MQSKHKHNKQHNLSLIENNTEIACYRCGSTNYKKLGLIAGKQRYFCRVCCRRFTGGLDHINYKPSYLELGEDVWDVSGLGVKTAKHARESKLVFLYFKQDWLKEAAKKFIRYQATSKSFRQLQRYVHSLSDLSNFLEQSYPGVTLSNFHRGIILDYIDYLNQKKLANVTKNKYLATLKLFFETGNVNFWFHTPQYLIRTEDYGKISNPLPRYIPEEVMQQLNQHLEALPGPVMRMVIVIQETGLRVGELLELTINCLKFNPKGEPFIQYMNWKMSKEDAKPISFELSQVIQEQQRYIIQHLTHNFQYLFCARTGRRQSQNNFEPKPEVMTDQVFIRFLKQLAQEFDIKDKSGKPWNFQTHQFRHTVGTRMINAGVPQHIIQRYLGHETPTMTMAYAHIFDDTLRREIEKYHESRVVNFQGETVELEDTILSSNDDLE
jgi:integrase